MNRNHVRFYNAWCFYTRIISTDDEVIKMLPSESKNMTINFTTDFKFIEQLD